MLRFLKYYWLNKNLFNSRTYRNRLDFLSDFLFLSVQLVNMVPKVFKKISL